MPKRRNPSADLKNVPLFSALSTRDLKAVQRAADQIDVPAGREIVQEGRTGHEFFLILDGNASVTRHKRKVATLGAGEYFGEMAVLDRGPRTASVTADTDMSLLVLGQREFAGLVSTVPGLASKLMVALAHRLREADVKSIRH
ncbi:MAG: cyclic nucleotide-binding domain-containing protein [Acidimicrobiia bacterium]